MTNIYNQSDFFDKYSQMSRSQKGLAGAGEWHTLKKVMPDFTDKTVLDLGCGYGWHCNYVVEQGARHVIGIDQSEKMLKVAREKFNSPKITYMKNSIENIQFEKLTFDVVISSLALHYVENYNRLIQELKEVTKPGGQLIFTVEHPVFTAYGSQDWHYNENGEILHFPVDNYYVEGKREAVFLGTKMTKYHRTLTTYLDTLVQQGFQLDRVLEAEPEEKKLADGSLNPEMRRPMMLIISAIKIGVDR